MADQSARTPPKKSLEAIDRAMLTPLVRRALRSENCEITDWAYHPIYGGIGDQGAGTSGIYRFAGKGYDKGEAVSWSLILKVIGSAAPGVDPQAGAREWLAYQSGVLNTFSGSLTSPRCYELVEHPNGEHWLWLEEVIDESGRPWSLQRYGTVARHLGQFNGAYLMGGSLPSWPWLGRDWLRTAIAPNESAIARLSETDVISHPLVSRAIPADVAAGLSRLWIERETFLVALDHLPQTLCHRDAFPRNLFVRRDGMNREQTVAIDWAFVGPGAIGEEIGPLIQASLAFFEIERTNIQALDRMVFDGYLAGLHDAGWQGDPRVVRFGYAASSSLRFGLTILVPLLDIALNNRTDLVKQVWGQSIEAVLDNTASSFRFLLDLADEARTLLDAVG